MQLSPLFHQRCSHPLPPLCDGGNKAEYMSCCDLEEHTNITVRHSCPSLGRLQIIRNKETFLMARVADRSLLFRAQYCMSLFTPTTSFQNTIFLDLQRHIVSYTIPQA